MDIHDIDEYCANLKKKNIKLVDFDNSEWEKSCSFMETHNTDFYSGFKNHNASWEVFHTTTNNNIQNFQLSETDDVS